MIKLPRNLFDDALDGTSLALVQQRHNLWNPADEHPRRHLLGHADELRLQRGVFCATGASQELQQPGEALSCLLGVKPVIEIRDTNMDELRSREEALQQKRAYFMAVK